MQHGIHFISGLPRAGSTLLAAILRQNPRFYAGMTSPVGNLFVALLGQMSNANEFALFIGEAQKRAILAGLFESYYREIAAERLVFDTNRLWCAKLPALKEIFPKAKLIACVRHVPWVLDSIERLVRNNKFDMSKIFNFDPLGTVYARLEGLTQANGLVGFGWQALKEAYYGEDSERLLVLTFETLTRAPEKAVAAVYAFIGEPPFAHDFAHLDYAADEFDARLGTPGLHKIAPQVRPIERKTILPPDLFARYENDSFWTNPALNLRGVKVV